MAVWALLLPGLAAAYRCGISLSDLYPRLTPATLEAALRNRKQGCPDPENVDLSDNDLDHLPEITSYLPLNAWSCNVSMSLMQQQQVPLQACQSLCTNSSSCSFISLDQRACLLYDQLGCAAITNNHSNSSIYRKKVFIVGMEDFQQLVYLDLAGNGLTTLPSSLRQFTTLTRLDLDNNQLSHLEDDTFVNLTYLETLELQNNALTNLTRALFVPLEELTSLRLDNNLLSSFSDHVFDDLIYLQFLSFDANNISNIPHSLFASLNMLTTLSFENNQISALEPDVFSHLYSLTELRMNTNPLLALPRELFRNTTRLQVLQVSHNQLSTLPSDFFHGLLNLGSLMLTHAEISALPIDLFNGLHRLTFLELDKPPECSTVRPCAGRVQVNWLNRTYAVSPSSAPTLIPPSVFKTPTSVPTSAPSALVLARATNYTVTSTASPSFFVDPSIRPPIVHSSVDQVDISISAGAITGIVLGALGCLCLCWLFFFCIRRHRDLKEKLQINPASPTRTMPSSVHITTGDHTEHGMLLSDSMRTICVSPTVSNTWSYFSPTSRPSTYSGASVHQPAPPALGLKHYDLTPTSSNESNPTATFVKGARPYTVLKLLGKGRFGIAYLVADPQSNLFVVKTITCNDHNLALKEAKTLALGTPSSPHLLKILDFFFEGDQFCIVLNYCAGGLLQDLVSQYVSPDEVERILREIATGLECLHSNDVIHRDLKPDNIFLLDSTSRTVVIGDMGMARPLNDQGYYDSHFGHLLYKATEIELGKYSPRSDMWAVGCIGYELLIGKSLAALYAQSRLVLGRSTPSELALALERIPEHCKTHPSFLMVSGLLVQDPYARLTARQLKEFVPQKPAITRFDYQ